MSVIAPAALNGKALQHELKSNVGINNSWGLCDYGYTKARA